MRIQVIEITEKVIAWMDIIFSPTELINAIDRTDHVIKIDFEDSHSMEAIQMAALRRAAKMKLKIKTRSKGLSLYFYKKGMKDDSRTQ